MQYAQQRYLQEEQKTTSKQSILAPLFGFESPLEYYFGHPFRVWFKQSLTEPIYAKKKYTYIGDIPGPLTVENEGL